MTDTELVADLTVRRPEGFALDVHLTIPAGTTTALLGPNGAGKSTAVAAIAGLLPLDAGRITFGDAVLDDPAAGIFVPPEKRSVGVVFQDYLLFPHLTVLENVCFGLRSRRIGRNEAAERSREWLVRLGLGGMERHRPGDLSGGQAQRVALARALVTQPDLLLLDEPLAALDVTTRGELRYTLGEHLAAFGGPRLLITHDPTEAFLLADAIHLIEDGVVTQSGTADDLRLRPRTRYAADLAGFNLFTGTAGGGTVEVDGRVLHTADPTFEGQALVTIHPTAVSLHLQRPSGSPRNVWETAVERVERLGDRVRLQTAGPVPLTVEVTAASRAEMDLEAGARVWVAVKATEMGIEAVAGPVPG